MRWLHIAKARYYRAHLVRDLFGEWTLVTVWGGLQSRLGGMHSTGVASYADGQVQIERIAKRRQQHGYEARPELPECRTWGPNVRGEDSVVLGESGTPGPERPSAP